ncbi:MAG: Pilus assembly protein [uncultured Thiotrichaceae bacterium]|uniref:Pilus assembly protein n=1 Tax=uncultured Thiotrichaceae bacterium TaxID=298394 RepID=A0A6S6TTL1_9GAMM|nr:MAG: Pilus assembly protein [uncultured Thiotrichaceae bacterium]
MKVLFDLNILLDVMQEREAFYAASATALSKSIDEECEGLIPGHAITTIHYLLARYTNKHQADEGVDFLLENFVVVNAESATFRNARQLAMKDFEDAVVASIAAKAGCELIVTRNVADFKRSPVPALLPEEFLERLG